MLATAPSVLYGIFRYLYLIYDRNDTRSTAAILTEDPGMVFAGISWVGAALAVLYVFDSFPRVDLTLSPDEQAFRDEVREWIAANHPGPSPTGGDQAQFEFEREWQRRCTRRAGPGSRGPRSTAAAAPP